MADISFNQSQHLSDNISALLKGCMSGDRSSQASLYQLYADKMMAVCLWYAHNREEAEEVLQDGFIRAFTYLHTYKGKGSFEGWLRKIMINAALYRYRHKTGLFIVSELPGKMHEPSEEADFAYNYDERELLKLIQQLPPACRMVFNLYVFEGFSHREIAEMLDIAIGTSKSNLSDARRWLRIRLEVKIKIASK